MDWKEIKRMNESSQMGQTLFFRWRAVTVEVHSVIKLIFDGKLCTVEAERSHDCLHEVKHHVGWVGPELLNNVPFVFVQWKDGVKGSESKVVQSVSWSKWSTGVRGLYDLYGGLKDHKGSEGLCCRRYLNVWKVRSKRSSGLTGLKGSKEGKCLKGCERGLKRSKGFKGFQERGVNELNGSNSLKGFWGLKVQSILYNRSWGLKVWRVDKVLRGLLDVEGSKRHKIWTGSEKGLKGEKGLKKETERTVPSLPTLPLSSRSSKQEGINDMKRLN